MANPKNEQMYKNYHFSDFSKWPQIIELLITCNALALILAIASEPHFTELKLMTVVHYLLFASWVSVCFAFFMQVTQQKLALLKSKQALIISFVVLIMIIWLSNCGLNILDFSVQNSLLQLDWQIITRGSFRHLVLGAGIGLIVLRYLYVREQWVAQQRAELMARVQALQARIHPHFLFNSLNSVVSLIMVDPFKAEQMLIDLSSLFRASLTELKEVSLEEEIELCKRYIQIESIRLEDRLAVEWRLDPIKRLKLAKIPLLTLQPLLENTIYHGVETLSKKTTVGILVEVVDQQVNIVLTNAYEIKELSRQGNGLAIDNIRQRLIAYYGESVKFNTFQKDGIYTTLLSYNYR